VSLGAVVQDLPVAGHQLQPLHYCRGDENAVGGISGWFSREERAAGSDLRRECSNSDTGPEKDRLDQGLGGQVERLIVQSFPAYRCRLGHVPVVVDPHLTL
jgi:hypothetical protein